LINPIIVRHARTQFRLERVGPIIALAAYLLLLVLAFFLTYMIGSSTSSSWQECLRTFWYELLAIQIFMLVVVGSIAVAGSVVREKEQKRFDFQIVTGMSPWQIAEGETFGSSLFYYFLILCTLPFMILCVLGGGIGWELFGYSYLILFTAAYFFHAWALLVSSMSRTYAGSIVLTLILIALLSSAALLKHHSNGALRTFSVISPFYLPYSSFTGDSEPGQVMFFNEYFPELFAVAVVYVFLGLWALNGAVRKIRNSLSPYISKLQAVFFTAVFLVTVAGLLVANNQVSQQTWNTSFFENTIIYLTLTLLLMFVLAFVLTPSPEEYKLMVRRKNRGVWNAIFGERSLFLVNMLVLLGVSMAVYFGVFAQAVFARAPEKALHLTQVLSGKMPIMHVFSGFFFVLLAILFYSLLIQLCALLSKRAGREIAALIILVLVLLPWLSEMWSGVAERGLVRVFNPVEVLVSILPAGTAGTGSNLSLAALIFYPVFSILLGALLYIRLKLLHARLAPNPPATQQAVSAAPGTAS